VSPDGLVWSLVSLDTIPFTGSIYFGLAANSRVDPTLCAVTFDQINLRTGAIADTVAPAIPAAPTLVGTASDVSVKLAWTGVTDDVGVISYQVFRNGTLVATVSALGYIDSGLTANTLYSYTIKAVDAAGNASAASAALNVTTAAATNIPAPWLHRDIGN